MTNLQPLHNSVADISGNPIAAPDVALGEVRDALRGLKFGVISIIVQDGVVVQIERTEKRRLRRQRLSD